MINNVGQPWNITEEKDDHNPDENGSQVNIFLHRSSGSFVRQSGENETADQDPINNLLANPIHSTLSVSNSSPFSAHKLFYDIFANLISIIFLQT